MFSGCALCDSCVHKTCPAQGLPKYLAQIEEVSEYASKEYSLERTLDKMQADWSGVRFDYMVWRNTGTSILRALDDIQMLLDDQTVKTQSMRASPYIGVCGVVWAVYPCLREGSAVRSGQGWLTCTHPCHPVPELPPHCRAQGRLRTACGCGSTS